MLEGLAFSHISSPHQVRYIFIGFQLMEAFSPSYCEPCYTCAVKELRAYEKVPLSARPTTRNDLPKTEPCGGVRA